MISRRRARLRIISLVVVLTGLLLAFALSGSLSSDKVRDWFDGYGAAGPIVFIACSSLLTVAMFPGPLLAGAAGLLFGTALGAPVAIVSATCGASLAFLVGRRWAHDAVEHLAGPRVQALRAWIGARGFHAVLLARLAPGVPYNVINYAAGLLFGTALGTPVAIVSATTGACLAFSLGRWWAHDAVESVAGRRVRAIRAWIGQRGFYAVLYARLAPGLPYNLVNYAAGLSPVSLRAFAAATAIGASPRAFAYAALGGHLGNLGSPTALVAIGLLVAMAIAGVITFRRSGPGTAMSSPGAHSEAPR